MKLKSAVLINALKVAFTQLKTNMSSTDDAVVFTQQTKMIAEQLAKLKIKTDSIGVDNAAVFTQQLKMITAQLAKIKLQMEEGEFVIFKEFDDTVGGVDSAVFSFFKVLTDSAAIAENAVIQFNKTLSDAAAITDDDVISFGKVPTDDVGLTDPLIKTFAQQLADNILAVEDGAAFGVSKPLSESPSVTDSPVPLFGKGLSEAAAFTDEVNTRALTKALANSVNATDDVDGEASILDDQEMQFFKNTTNVATVAEIIAIVTAYSRTFSDSFGVTDGDVLNFGKRPLDTIPITDAGSLRSQGYCDFTYFEGDYVGASRTF